MPLIRTKSPRTRNRSAFRKATGFVLLVSIVCLVFLSEGGIAGEVTVDELPVSELPTEGGDALNELMRSLHGRRIFDNTLHGLEGNYEIAGEVRGVLEENGDISRVRLVAMRREDGVFDRRLILEIIPQEGDSFIIPLPEDVRGVQSSIELKNFTSGEKSEILLTLNSGIQGNRFLIISVSGRRGNVIFDTRHTRIPTITGRFLNNYRAEIIVRETGERVLIDLSARRNEYHRRLVFNTSGTLRSAVAVRADRFSQIDFVDTDNNGMLDIRKVIDLSGAGHSDRIAYAEALLKFDDGRWNVADTWISPAGDLARIPLPTRIN